MELGLRRSGPEVPEFPRIRSIQLPTYPQTDYHAAKFIPLHAYTLGVFYERCSHYRTGGHFEASSEYFLTTN